MLYTVHTLLPCGEYVDAGPFTREGAIDEAQRRLIASAKRRGRPLPVDFTVATIASLDPSVEIVSISAAGSSRRVGLWFGPEPTAEELPAELRYLLADGGFIETPYTESDLSDPEIAAQFGDLLGYTVDGRQIREAGPSESFDGPCFCGWTVLHRWAR